MQEIDSRISRNEFGIMRELKCTGVGRPAMKRCDAYYWRIFATGLCFAVFGLGGLALGLFVFPVLRLLPASAPVHRSRVLRTLRSALHLFIRVMRGLGVLSFRFEGVEKLGRPGQVIVANHPSLIDVVFLIAFVPEACCVVKGALWRNPFTRGPVTAAGYVSNNPTDRMIEAASEALRERQSVIIFPEGTRTTPGQALQFHRGAASIAIRAAAVVTPVFISCRPTTLSKGSPWYRVPDKRACFVLKVGDDIDPDPFRAASPAPIAGRALNKYLLERFEAELAAERRAETKEALADASAEVQGTRRIDDADQRTNI
jgi:1-acyl-sn-glycerol-3-phosphate acyltransferase